MTLLHYATSMETHGNNMCLFKLSKSILKWTFIIVILFLSGVLCACTNQKSLPEQRDALSILKIDSEDITSIELGYKNQYYPLFDASKKHLIESLQKSVSIEVESRHEYTPSDYVVRFVLDNGESLETCFYFFSGLTRTGRPNVYDPADTFTYADRRFDIRIDHRILHFQFSSEYYWTEDDVRIAFDRMARAIGSPTRAELDGFDEVLHPSQKIIAESLTWQEVVDSADVVLLAKYHSKICDSSISEDNTVINRFLLAEGYLYSPRLYDLFSTIDILKGDWSSKTICLPANVTGKIEIDGYGHQHIISLLPDVRDPEYEEGQTYLLCIAYKEDITGYYYTTYGRVASTAILDGDYLYPRHNTEYHPFNCVLLEEVGDYCR